MQRVQLHVQQHVRQDISVPVERILFRPVVQQMQLGVRRVLGRRSIKIPRGNHRVSRCRMGIIKMGIRLNRFVVRGIIVSRGSVVRAHRFVIIRQLQQRRLRNLVRAYVRRGDI